MSLTSKSPQDVAREALAAGTAALAPYSHKFSPKTFTQPQLFACLTLKKFYKTDYRGIAAQLRDHSDLRQILGLKKIPHFTTLQKAAVRLLSQQQFRVLLRSTLERAMKNRRTVRRAAMDSSGFACGHASRYYVKRRAKGQKRNESPAQCTLYKRYAKLETVFDTRTHVAIGALTSSGPAPDVDRLVSLLQETDPGVKIESLLADAGYDSEVNHVFARVGCQMRSLMPARHGRPSDKPPTGYWRRVMTEALSSKTKRKRSGYSQRAQAETGFSMIKRRQGESVAARTFENQCGELRLMVLTHNLMICYVRWVFYRACLTPFSGLFLVPFSGLFLVWPGGDLAGDGSLFDQVVPLSDNYYELNGAGRLPIFSSTHGAPLIGSPSPCLQNFKVESFPGRKKIGHTNIDSDLEVLLPLEYDLESALDFAF